MTQPNHFQRLGLPGRFVVDASALERAYLERSRLVHPDFHAHATPEARSASLGASAALNEAYTTLKDPYRRAEYLLGVHLGDSPQPTLTLPASFLMEAMELRERIEAATQSRGQEIISAVEDEIVERIGNEQAAVARLFDSDLPIEALLQIREHLNVWKTLTSLRRSIGDATTW